MSLRYLAGPLIGAVIGYFTNYIAVKMLFYPRQEVKLFGKTLPFTPGAIPKGKPRLAKAIGAVVGETLVTKEDLETKLLSDDVITGIGDMVVSHLSGSIKELSLQLTGNSDEKYSVCKEKIAEVLSTQIVQAVSEMDLSGIITEKGLEVINEKLAGTMFQLFLTDGMITSVIAPIGNDLQLFIADHGVEYVQPALLKRMDALEEQGLLDTLNTVGISDVALKNILTGLLSKALPSCIGRLMDQLDLASIAEEKINDMSVDELESMVLTVMKKELNTIVNLGALIGFLLGLFNLLIR